MLSDVTGCTWRNEKTNVDLPEIARIGIFDVRYVAKN